MASLVWSVSSVTWAQMESSSHTMSANSIKSATCIGSSLDCANAATPFLTNEGKLVLVWTAGGAVSVARSDDFGKTFSPAVKIAEHGKWLDTGSDARPQLVVDSKGHILIAYALFKDTQWNAQINTVRSLDGGRTFTSPEPLIKDGTSERFPMTLIGPDGGIFMTWIDKRLIDAAKLKGVKKLGASIAYSFSNDGGKTFKSERIANEDSCECCLIGASLDPKGRIIIAYRAIFPNSIRDHATQIISSKGSEKIRRISNDEWKTDACPHHGPSIAISDSDTIHTAWFTQGKVRSGVFYAHSKDHGANYSTPIPIGKEGALISRPNLLAIGNSVWMVWKEFDGQNALIFMKKSNDDGKTWSPEKSLLQTSGYSDHPLLISMGGQVFLSWLTRIDGYRLIEIGLVE